MDLPDTNLDWLWDRTVYLTTHGSRAYGTNTPTSDIDRKGVAVPPKEYYYGYLKKFEQAEFKQNVDMVVFGANKFFKLAADCNPAVIEILFTDPEQHLIVKPEFETVLANRDLFISAKAKHTFSGYASAQMKRIKNHHRWMNGDTEDDGDDKHYEEWKASRNPVRSALEEKYGYDTKHGMHLVRLMRMCKEILSTGKVIVKRPDAEELLSIRNGAWSYDQLLEWAATTEIELESLYETTTLPKSANHSKIDAMLVALVEKML